MAGRTPYDFEKASRAWLLTKTHAYTLWLFTYSDLKTIVGPKTAFGTLSALRVTSFSMPPQPILPVLARIPLVAFWAWINLLPFAIDNQRHLAAIEEDSVNKPWRPLPSKRIAASTAKSWMLVLYPIAIISSVWLGGIRQSLSLIALGFWYNDAGGADNNPLTRNFINAAGFASYTSGAMEVAHGAWLPLPLGSALVKWLFLIGLIVFTTVQSQDMYDQAGDQLRGRRTVPLTISDGLSRISIALPVAIWSWFGPYYWQSHIVGYAIPCLLGCIVVVRTLGLKSVEDDKQTFRIWNLWLVSLYLLPVIR